MKIAFIVTKFPSLSQTFILNQITGLIDRGHEVDIYALKPDSTSKVHADVIKYNLLDRTYYFRDMPQDKFRFGVDIIKLLIKFYYKKPENLLKAGALIKHKANTKIFSAIIPFLDKRHYDIIHCHFGPNGILGVMLRDVGITKGKVVTTFHGYDISAYVEKYGNNVYDTLFIKGDLFLPISERWRNKLVELGCNERKIVVHRMGIDSRRFSFSPRKLRDDNIVRFLTICRFVEKKGVDYAIRAVAQVLRKYPKIEYNIAGDGPLKNCMEELVGELNIADKVKLLGWKQQEEIVMLLNDADILIAPSITGKDGDQEGIPVVLMESLAQGIPVLSTQHSGIPEVVQDGKSGFLVPERNVNALAEKLVFFIEHPEIWSKMGKAGREYVEKCYDIDTLNDKLVDLYQHLIDGKLTQQLI